MLRSGSLPGIRVLSEGSLVDAVNADQRAQPPQSSLEARLTALEQKLTEKNNEIALIKSGLYPTQDGVCAYLCSLHGLHSDTLSPHTAGSGGAVSRAGQAWRCPGGTQC